MPGFALALRCADAYDAHVRAGKRPTVIVLERHGIFTFGATAKESYEAMIAAVSAAERYVIESRRTVAVNEPVPAAPASPAELAHALRGNVAKLAGFPFERAPIVHHRVSEGILAFLARPDAEELCSIGCATPDHVLRTKPTPLFLRLGANRDEAARGAVIAGAVAAYAANYDAYVAEMCRTKEVLRTKLDSWPRVVLVPGLGLFTLGHTLTDAKVAADVYEHTMAVIDAASLVGTYAPVSLFDLFDVEYWSLEQAKLKKAAPRPLADAVALVTGAASGIGHATAAKLALLGAHVVLVDLDGERVKEAALALKGGDTVTWAVADVTKPDAVAAAFAHATSAFGGVDIVVSNAGTAPSAELFAPEGDSLLRESLDVNLLSHNHVAREAVSVFRAQGRGGCLLFNVSKAAFAPGPKFGPYAVAKAGLLGLMRQYAIDGAPYGVRSNAVNADRIRTGLFAGGVAEARAAARGMTVDAYFTSNLLGREVTLGDVADAFGDLATARATTGCVVTVDGGNPAAFPR